MSVLCSCGCLFLLHLVPFPIARDMMSSFRLSIFTLFAMYFALSHQLFFSSVIPIITVFTIGRLLHECIQFLMVAGHIAVSVVDCFLVHDE